MRSIRRSLPLALSAAVSLVCAGLAAAAPAAAEQGRETFFPRSGNVGYDARQYNVRVEYRPRNGFLRGSVVLKARALQPLTRFSLDLNGLRVTEVEVDGALARFNRGRDKLKITAPSRIDPGDLFGVLVHYQGKPRRVTDPDGGIEGWLRTDDGALAVGEPVGTAAWLPCNNVPADKAAFKITLSVPAGLAAVSNGRLAGVERFNRRRLFTWIENEPMSPYLALVDIGRGRLVKSRPIGLPAWTLVDPRQAHAARQVLAKLPKVLRFESRIFGPYPFDWAGSAVDVAPELEYALETQTRPIYAFVPDLTTLVHETAHQWFGDSVGLKIWPDIWLNEGFATWTEWFYAERHGGRSARQIFHRLYRTPARQTEFWDPPSGDPGSPKHLFATSTYVRGGMALEALREKIGITDLLALLRRWATGHAYASAETAQFTQLAEEVSGRSLERFFRLWLYRPGKPPGFGSL